MTNNSLIPMGKIDRAILTIRGFKVMLDIDLAEIYGVKTSRLNEPVKRNRNRFPDDFMFQLTSEEKKEVIAKCDHLNKLKFSRTNPYAFTEHGTIMLANIKKILNLTIPVASHGVFRQIVSAKKLRNRIFIISPLCPTSGGTSPLKIRGEYEETSRQATRNFSIKDSYCHRNKCNNCQGFCKTKRNLI